MKKILIALIVVIAVALGSFLWIRSQIGLTDSARLLPPGAVFYAALPDLPRSALRWPQTALAKIGAEPEVAGFLEKPLGAVTGRSEGVEARDLLVALKPGRLFFAVTDIAADSAAAVVGFQFWGSRDDFDSAVAGLRRAVYRGNVPEAESYEVGGVGVVATPLPTGELLTAASGRWGFIANNRDSLAAVIERAGGEASEPSLAEDPVYTAVLARLPGDPDVVAFARVEPLLDALLEVGENMGAEADASQVAQLRQARGIGFAAKMDGADLRDAIFVLRPETPDTESLEHTGMAFTSSETLGYFDALLGLHGLSDMATSGGVGGNLPPQASAAMPFLASLPEALSDEASLAFSWPEGQMRPDVLLAAGVRDAALAEQMLIQAASNLPETTIAEEGGFRVFSFPSLRSPLVDPTIALGEDILLGALDPGEIAAALARKEAGKTLEASPAFAPVLPVYRRANLSFGFIDAKGLFQRTYPVARQMISFGAALIPGASDYLDPSKMPETEVVAQHLGPITYSQSRLPDGYLVESSGPVTMNQVLIAAGAGATALLPKGQETP